jgi:hypothetical protein
MVMKTSNIQLTASQGNLNSSNIKLQILAVLKSIFKLFIPFFTNGNEPRIWTTTDRDGNTTWHAYDPVSDRTTSLDSESEMRIWIEQRYYN